MFIVELNNAYGLLYESEHDSAIEAEAAAFREIIAQSGGEAFTVDFDGAIDFCTDDPNQGVYFVELVIQYKAADGVPVVATIEAGGS